MLVQIRLPTEQLNALKVLCSFGKNELDALAAGIISADPVPIKPEVLLPVMESTLKVPRQTVDAVMRQLLSLYALQRQRNVKPDEVIAGLDFAFNHAGSDFEWTSTDQEHWQSVKASLEKLLDLEAMWVIAKALDLAYEYANLFQSARIVTDIRPVFGKDDQHIKGAVISHTLRIYYDNPEGGHSISLTLDKADIEELVRSCQRALVKAVTAKAHMGAIPTIISGEV